MAGFHQYLLFLLMLCTFDIDAQSYSDIEAKLTENLLVNYSVNGRPASSNNHPVIIAFDLKVHKIEKLLTKEQHLILHSFVTMRWIEPRFTWDPANYNGTKMLVIRNSLIWTPDIVLYNKADISNNAPPDFYKAPAHVYYNGSIVWFSTVAWQSSCAVDVTWFPVDEQTCDLIFGSLSHSKSRVKLFFHKHPKKFSDLKSNHHVTNGEWTVLSFSARTKEAHYDCCHEPMSQVIFTLKLKRRPLYFFLYLIFPVIAIVLLSLLIFKIPALCGERIGFGVTILLTMGVYLIVISQDLPRKADKAPLVGVLYVTLFYVMVLGVVTGTINATFAYKTTNPPEWLYMFALRVQRRNKTKKVGAKKPSTRSVKKMERFPVIKESEEMTDLEFSKDLKKEDEVENSVEENPVKSPRRAFLTQRSSCSTLANAPVTNLSDEDLDNQMKWHEIAYVSDHIFFWIYFVLIIVSSGSVMLGLQLRYT